MSAALSPPRTRWSIARIATVAGLIAGTAGIVIMRIGGAEMPAVPPGAVLMIVAAVLVGVVRSRWAAGPAALVALMEVIAVMVTLPDLGDDTVVSIGMIARAIGVVAALAGAGTILVRGR